MNHIVFSKPSDNRASELRALVSYYLAYHNYKKPELAMKMGVSTASFYRKLKDPKTFTYKEILQLFDVLNLTEEQKLKVV